MKVLAAAVFLAIAGVSPAQTLTIVNGASSRAGQPVAAGSWATAYGAFANVSQAVATVTPIPQTLGGVTVSVGDVPAPVYFVSATQVNFLVPGSVSAGVKTVEVKTAGGSLTGMVRVMSAAPGIFANNGNGAVLNQDYSVNGEGNRASRGQVVQIFATGPGALTRAVADGAAAPAEPLALTVSTPEVYIGGVAAQVLFSGMAPGFAGVWQINAVVPDRNFVSGRVPMQVFMDGVDSNEVNLFVQ